MPFTQGEVLVRQLDPTCWALVEPVVYRGRWETWTVPAGFETDFASVPRLVVWLLPTYGLYTKAAILHDFLLAEPSVTRTDADGLFRRSMGELGVCSAAAVDDVGRGAGRVADAWGEWCGVARVLAGGAASGRVRRSTRGAGAGLPVGVLAGRAGRVGAAAAVAGRRAAAPSLSGQDRLTRCSSTGAPLESGPPVRGA